MATLSFSGSIYSLHGAKRGRLSFMAYSKPLDRADEILNHHHGSVTNAQHNEIIIEYMPTIKYMADRFAGRLPAHISTDDLVSAGVMGLMDAVKKYDPSKETRFKTYAEFRIKGAMLDELRAMDWIPRSVRKKSSELSALHRKLELELGRPPEDEEMAGAMGISLDEYFSLLEETKAATFLDIDSLRQKFPEGSEDVAFELMASPEVSDPFLVLDMLEAKDTIIKAIESLREKERMVVTLYYYEELTMKEIGAIMGYTESRISQMHSKAMMRLRSSLFLG